MQTEETMRDVRFGVIGAGYWGPHLIRNISEIPGSRLAAIADLSQDRLDALHPRYPYAFMTTDYRRLINDDIDAVVIATPVNTHFKLAQEALMAGKHVLVEKPVTRNSEDARELVRLADEKDVLLMVGHTFEFNPAVQALKDIVDSGVVGRVLYIDAARLNLGQYRSDVNVLWDLAPHDISIMNFILGAEPTHVSARGNTCINPSTHDVAYVELKYPNGVLGHIHVSWLEPCKVRRLTVVGDEKMVVYNDVAAEEKLRIYDKGVTKTASLGDYADFQLSYHYGGVTIPAVPGGEPLKLELKHMIDCIQTGRRPRSDGMSGLNVIKVLEAPTSHFRTAGW